MKKIRMLVFVLAALLLGNVAYGQDDHVPGGFGNRNKVWKYINSGRYHVEFTQDSDTLKINLYHNLYAIDLEIGNVRKFGVDTTGYFYLARTAATTTGTERAAYIEMTQTGAGATIEGLYSYVIADVQTGSWTNGIVGRVDYSTGSTGDAGGGMAAAICAEMNLPARTPSGGSYYAFDAEIEAPANFTSIASPTAFPMAFYRTGLWGNTTAKNNWEDYGYIFHFDDITDATGNVWFDNTLRVLVNTSAFYIPLSDAQGEYSSAYYIDISNADDASSTITGSIQTDGGMGVVKQLYLGDDLDMSTGTTGVYDITLNDNQADALSIVRGTTDMIVFTSTTASPLITITPNTAITGDLAVDGTANLDNTDIDGTFTMDGATYDVNATTSLALDNTNASNGVTINTATSGSPISIGHTTSETTVNDNLNVTGDADVEGDVYLLATKKVILADDADDHTYIAESAADVISVYVGSVLGMTITESTTITGSLKDAWDVVGAFTANTIVSDGNVGGTTGTFTDEVDITKSTAGIGLDVNYTATSFTDLLGAVDIRRTGALTGVLSDYIIDLNVLPALTFTEPASGTAYYYGGNIDLTSVAVTAGAGTSVLSALNLVAGTDGDAGENWALQTTGNVEITGADLATATDNAVNIIATTSITTGSNYAVEISHTNTAGSAANLGALFATTTAGANGSGFMGLMSRVDMDTYQASTGGANALYGEILLPNDTQNGGEYHVAVLTLAEKGTSFASSATVDIPTSFLKFETWGGGADWVDDDDYLFYMNGFTAEADHLVSLTSQTARVNVGKKDRYMVLSQMQDGLGLGVSGTPMVLAATTDQATEIFSTGSSTSGNHFHNYIKTTSTAQTTGGHFALYVENDVAYQAAGQMGGYFKVDMNAVQAPTGGASVVNAELVMPTGVQNGGQYNAFVADVECPETMDMFYNPALPSGFMKLEVYGNPTAVTDFNLSANLFNLSGITAATDAMLEATTIAAGNVDLTHSLRINIGGTAYYIGLNTAKTW